MKINNKSLIVLALTLISSFASAMIDDTNEKNALMHRAIKENNLDQVLALIIEGVEPNDSYQHIHFLETACKYSKPEIVRTLLELKADPNIIASSCEPLLIYTVSFSSKNLFELLRYGADVHAETPSGRQAIHKAALFGKADATRTLLQYKANPNKMGRDGKTALDIAQNYKKGSHFTDLISSYVDCNFPLAIELLQVFGALESTQIKK